MVEQQFILIRVFSSLKIVMDGWISKLYKVLSLFVLFVFAIFSSSCTSTKIIDSNPINKPRGDSSNPIKVKTFLEDVLLYPEGREIKAYGRKAFSVGNRKTIFVYHNFYVFIKDGRLEHTLVYTATPKESELDGTWMLDASSDIESYELYLNSDNPWELQEYLGPKGQGVSLLETSHNILDRLSQGYKFAGTAGLRHMAWYHHFWMFLVPPPIIAYTAAMIASMGRDNCISAVNETIVWEKESFYH
ncbi:hypothetical protein EXM22_17925 [Oceanispirochaeta crateris]|uniref:Uncharacterized protein n=1 Tax=Oceanispirochaeta crateris TaxID=2518645 RepID=A0A5C1QRC9_9SPIO|nr:hypothetical protein [Oceanispirochaeta crateris]QEN09769.1 hypothetical protein EXM22_17925 [Oceanispirochaeta crateris]